MTSTTRRETLALLAASGTAGLLPAAAARAAGGAGQIDALLDGAAKSGSVAGVVAAATDGTSTLYTGAAGKRRLGQDQAMTPDTVFWIASMTKPITSLAAMQLVEQGRLSLTAPIATVLPDLANPMVLEGFDEAGAPILRPARRPITLHDLLTHTAGFSYDIWNANTARYEKSAGLPPLISCQNAALRIPLDFDPGARWEYGINIDFAGKAVEAVSGQRLEAYFHDHILGPLGMSDTGFRIGVAQRARLAGMHARQPPAMHMPDADGELAAIDFEMPQEPEFFMGGGGLYSTAPDYLRFTRMILNRGSLEGVTIVKPETVALMAQNQIGALDVTMLKTVAPQSSQNAEFFPGMVKKWGYGFMLNTAPAPTGRSPGSLAWAGLANTYFWIDPTRQRAGVILMQFLPFADEKALGLFSQFETAVYGLS